MTHAQCEAELAYLSREYDELVQWCDQTKKKFDVLSAQNRDLRDHIDLITKEGSAMEAENDTLRRDIVQAIDIADELGRENSALKEKNSRLRELHKKNKDDVEAYVALVQTLETDLEGVKSAMDVIKQTYTRAEKTKDKERTNQTKTLKERNAALVLQLEEADEKYRVFKELFDREQGARNGDPQEVAKLKEELEQANEKYTFMREITDREQGAMKERIKESDAEMEMLRADIETIEFEADQKFQHAKNTYSRDLKNLRNEIKELQERRPLR